VQKTKPKSKTLTERAGGSGDEAAADSPGGGRGGAHPLVPEPARPSPHPSTQHNAARASPTPSPHSRASQLTRYGFSSISARACGRERREHRSGQTTTHTPPRPGHSSARLRACGAGVARARGRRVRDRAARGSRASERERRERWSTPNDTRPLDLVRAPPPPPPPLASPLSRYPSAWRRNHA
jgi:hypothetical protein